MMLCEKCSRPLGPELQTCPQRDEGACPYQVAHNRLEIEQRGRAVWGGLALCLVAAASWWLPTLALWARVGVAALFVLGVGMALTGVLCLAREQTILYNLDTGQSWQKTTFLKIPLNQKTVGPRQPLPWLGSPGRWMRYPASVAALYRGGNAADMIATALLQLLAHEEILLYRAESKARFGNGRCLFVFTPGPGIGSAPVSGGLEARILEAVALAQVDSPDFDFHGGHFPRSCRALLTLEDLLVLVFEGEKAQPNNYMIGEVVGPEAEALNLGLIKGKRALYLAPHNNTRGRIGLDIRSVEQLHRDFWTTYPEVAKDLLIEIDLLILNTITGLGEAASHRTQQDSGA